jgi:hypothetical protein
VHADVLGTIGAQTMPTMALDDVQAMLSGRERSDSELTQSERAI